MHKDIRKLKTSSVLASVLLFCAQFSIAAGDNPNISTAPTNLAPVSNPQFIRNSLLIDVTPSGQKVFATNLLQLVENGGAKIRDNTIDVIKYEMPEPVSISQLASDNPTQFGMIQSVRTVLESMFMGFKVNDPKWSFELDGLTYHTDISNMSLSLDSERMSDIHMNRGAIFNFDFEVRSFALSVNELRIDDQNNAKIFKGHSFGASNIQVNLKGNPIRIHIPVLVHMHPNGELFIATMRVSENVQDAKLNLTFGKLNPPKDIAIIVNGEKYPLSKDFIESQLRATMPKILESVRKSLVGLATKNLPEYINTNFKDFITSKLEHRFAIPSINVTKKDFAPLGAGIRLQESGINPIQENGHQNLLLAFKGFLETTDRTASSLNDTFHISNFNDYQDVTSGFKTLNNGAQLKGDEHFYAAATPNFAKYPDTHDVKAALNKGYINRLLRLSWERGSLPAFPTPSGDAVRLIDAPFITEMSPKDDNFNQDMTSAFVRLGAWVEKGRSGFKQFATFSSSIRVYIEIIAKIEVTNDTPDHSSGLKITPSRIDLKSTRLDPSSLRAEWSEDYVLGQVNNILSGFSEFMQNNPTPLKSVVPLDRILLGTKVSCKGLAMDRTGYIMLFYDIVP